MPRFEYDCLVYNQRPAAENPLAFCLFHAPAGDVRIWADILRLEAGPGGSQRSLNGAKVQAIKRFLQHTANTIPSAVIISLNLPEEALIKEGDVVRKIRFEYTPDTPKLATVIDGQHRLLGVNEKDPTMHINVIALLTGDELEAAFQFLVINNKATKVPTDHIKALLVERDSPQLQARLRTARMSTSKYEFVATIDTDPDSPFMNQIDWPTNRTGTRLVPPAAVETAIRDIQERRIPEFDDRDTLFDYFFVIWRTVKATWPDLWVADSKLLSKVGVFSFTQYVTNSVASSYDLGQMDITNADAIRLRTVELLNYQHQAFWTGAWSLTGKDNPVGRKAVVDALIQIGRNKRAGREWSEDVALLESETE